MKTRAFFLVAVLVLLPSAAFAQANPLKELVAVRGSASLTYERAVGKRAGFVELNEHAPQSGIAVSVVDDGGTGYGDTVAAAYLEGLRKVLPKADLQSAWPAGGTPRYQARIGISSEEGRMGEDSKLIVGAMGTTCQEQEGMLKCEEADNAPNALGRSKGTWINPKVTVMVRLYRADPDNPSAEPSVLSEDVYSVSYVQTECKDPGAAAATVARLVGEQTLLGRAVNVDFPTSPRALNCNPR